MGLGYWPDGSVSSRLLNRNASIYPEIASPSTSVIEINSRQSLVAYFYSRPHLRSDLVRSLSDVEDATRIVQKFLVGRGDASDLSAVCSTIDVWSSIKKRIEMERKMEEEENGHIVEGDWASIDALMSRLNSLGDLATTIKAAVGPRNGLLEANTIDVGPDEKSASTEHQFASSLFSDTTTSFNWTVRPESVNVSEINAFHSLTHMIGSLRSC